MNKVYLHKFHKEALCSLLLTETALSIVRLHTQSVVNASSGRQTRHCHWIPAVVKVWCGSKVQIVHTYGYVPNTGG
jgi:hypothetical protein